MGNDFKRDFNQLKGNTMINSNANQPLPARKSQSDEQVREMIDFFIKRHGHSPVGAYSPGTQSPDSQVERSRASSKGEDTTRTCASQQNTHEHTVGSHSSPGSPPPKAPVEPSGSGPRPAAPTGTAGDAEAGSSKPGPVPGSGSEQPPLTLKELLEYRQKGELAATDYRAMFYPAAIESFLTPMVPAHPFGMQAYRDQLVVEAGAKMNPMAAMLIEEGMLFHMILPEIVGKAVSCRSTDGTKLLYSLALRVHAEVRLTALAVQRCLTSQDARQVTVINQQGVQQVVQGPEAVKTPTAVGKTNPKRKTQKRRHGKSATELSRECVTPPVRDTELATNRISVHQNGAVS